MPFPTSSLARSGRFTDIRPIGRGACGQVYVARDNLGRLVAVKEALPGDEEFTWVRAKFHKEARLQAALHHPQIIAIYSLEEDADTRELYLVCEYANGGSLADHLAASRVPEAQAILIGRDMCAALDATWQQLIVHRDIKPSNILLIKDAAGAIVGAKLGDFGIAQDQKQRRTTLLPGIGHPGTPLYMPPEQGNIATVLDVRSDIYALGVTLWEMQAGRDLKLLPSVQDASDLQAHHPPISPGMASVIWQAVQPDREQRYPTPAEMSADLAAVRDGTWLPARQTIVLPRKQALAARPAAIERPRRWISPVALLASLVAIVAVLLVGLLPISMSSGAADPPSAPILKPIDAAIVAAKSGQLSAACFKQQLASSSTPPIEVGEPIAAAGSLAARDLVKDGQLIARWDAQTQAAQAAFSPDGQTFATALADGTIQLWPADGGKPLRTLCLPNDGAPSTVGLAFLDGGKTIAGASAGGHILFWQVSDGALVREIVVDTQAVEQVAFAPDGQTLAASVDKGTSVQLFNIESAKPLRTNVWNANGAVSLAFSPDSQLLAIGEVAGNVRLIQLDASKEQRAFPVPAGTAPSLAFAPDGQTLAVGLADGTVQIWQIYGSTGRTLAGQTELPVYPAFAADGQTLALARMDGKVELWDVRDGTLLRTLEGGPTKGRASLAFSPDGSALVAAWEAGTIELWGPPAKPTRNP